MALADSITAYYKLDETSGTTANDEVGTNDGTITNATVNQTGKIGKCVSFDGSGDKITLASDIGWTKLSISFWFKNNSFTGDAYLMGKTKATVTVNADIELEIGFFDSGTKLQAKVRDATGQRNQVEYAKSNFTNGTWYHCVITFNEDDDRTYMYINGSKVAENLSATSTHNNLTEPMNFGMAWSGAGDYNGYLDEIGIWTRELSSTEVSTLYNSGNGLSYPFPTNATVTPATLTLSTTDADPVFKISPTTLSLGSSLNLSNVAIIIQNRTASSNRTIGTRYLNKHYVDAPYIYKNGVARKVGYYGS